MSTTETEAHQGLHDDPLRDPMALDPLSPIPPPSRPFGRASALTRWPGLDHNQWETSHA
jgi:hypothetical protein